LIGRCFYAFGCNVKVWELSRSNE